MLGMGFERLEPCAEKLASTVLMGVLRSNTRCLPSIEAYFTKVYYLMDKIRKDEEYHLIEYNQDLFRARYGDNFVDVNDDDYDQELDSYFWEKLSYWTVYFQPLKYNEGVAHECGLIPFKYIGEHEDLELLALGGCGMDLGPKLDAYQALTDGTIDEHSKLFSDKEYFQYVVGINLTKKVLKAIATSKK